MVASSATERYRLPEESIEGAPGWHTVNQWLEAEQYDQVTKLLQEARATAERQGDKAVAGVLAAACQICRTCHQYRAETESRQQAYQEAVNRERELRLQLQAILTQIGAEKAEGTPALPASLSNWKSPSLWQRVQALLGWDTGSQRSPEIPQVDEESIPPVEEAETSIDQSAKGLGAAEPAIEDTPSEDMITSAETREVRSIKGGQLPDKNNEPTASQVEEIGVPDLMSVLTKTPVNKSEEESDLPSLVVYSLGAFRVYQDDRLITDWNGLKGLSIFKYLVANNQKPVAKDVLMETFWPDYDPESARRNLHQAIYSLRQALRDGYPDFQHVLFENDCYLLNPQLDIWLDHREFEKHVKAGRRLARAGQEAKAMAVYGIAEGLYQGDFLEEDLYEDWARLPRDRYRNMYLDVTDRLSEYYVEQGECTAAIMLCQKVLARDNCHEGAHRRLMRCYIAQRQRHLAVRQYQICRDALARELDLEPSPETTALYQQLTAQSI